MQIKVIAYILISLVLLSGCVTVNSVKYSPEIYPATNLEDIKVFSVRPSREYIEIGEVSVEAPVYDALETIEELRKKVSQMGGQAVILRLQESKGIVIRFKE
ncbi:hypothetical protein ACFL2J_07830 [Candidatus Omnitrophota bacterium]